MAERHNWCIGRVPFCKGRHKLDVGYAGETPPHCHAGRKGSRFMIDVLKKIASLRDARDRPTAASSWVSASVGLSLAAPPPTALLNVHITASKMPRVWWRRARWPKPE